LPEKLLATRLAEPRDQTAGISKTFELKLR
jgi:hypothetical protein